MVYGMSSGFFSGGVVDGMVGVDGKEILRWRRFVNDRWVLYISNN